MGTFMFWSGPNRLFNSTLKKLEPRLAEEGYVGYIDLNCIVNGNGIYPLEFTSHFGYPTISIQQEGMITPIQFYSCQPTSGNVMVGVSPWALGEPAPVPALRRPDSCRSPSR